MTKIDLHTDTAGLTINARAFQGALSDANLFRSTDDVRPSICQVKVERRDGRLIFTATDSYTLIERTMPADDGPEWTFHIPGDDVAVLIAHVRSAGRGNVGIHVDDGRMTVTAGGRDLVCTEEAHDLPFPDTDKLWPTGEPSGGTIAFNPTYLARLNRLSEVKSHFGYAKFHPAGELKPCLVTVRESTRCLFMPVRPHGGAA